MKTFRAWFATLAVATLAMATFACENTAQGVKKDAAEAKEEAREGSAEAKEEAREAKEEVREETAGARDAAGRAVDKTTGAVKEAGDAIHAAKQTVDVKAALTADSTIDASHIDVDTNHETKTVTLNGTVPTAAQKTAAERVAKDKAEGYAVKNMLTVARR